MSPPNDETGVSSDTDVIGAIESSAVAAVFSETVTVPRSAFVGVAAAVKVAVSGKVATTGAIRLRVSSGTGRSSLISRRRRCRCAARPRSGWLRHSIIS